MKKKENTLILITTIFALVVIGFLFLPLTVILLNSLSANSVLSFSFENITLGN